MILLRFGWSPRVPMRFLYLPDASTEIVPSKVPMRPNIGKIHPIGGEFRSLRDYSDHRYDSCQALVMVPPGPIAHDTHAPAPTNRDGSILRKRLSGGHGLQWA